MAVLTSATKADSEAFAANREAMDAAIAEIENARKTAGAGGGDIGIVLARDADAIDDFVSGELPNGFRAMDLGLDPEGVKVSGGD